MTKTPHFDYLIIGSGLAGLQLALKMAEDAFFRNKVVALIDPQLKTSNDKTWSFWEKPSSQWNSIVYKSWDHARVLTKNKQTELNLFPYKYKTIRALDFYNTSKKTLHALPNFEFINETATDISVIDNTPILNTENNAYRASHIFDSRLPTSFSYNAPKSISIIQHFKGWVIQTPSPCFEDNCITMMDYRLKDGAQTTFTYVLPFSKTKALVEFTYFTSNLVQEETYDEFIQTYIKKYLNIENFETIETEMGQIPMTTFPFENFNSKHITKIGTGGGWVKGSTGYSFKHTEKKVAKIIENLKGNKQPSDQIYSRKHKFYDKVFLKVLQDNNAKGEWIFQQFYSKNSPQTMLRFLDEESSFYEELKIMWSLFSWSFIKAFFKTL
ncbi:lycopene cyclase family protein [Cognatitamlana onchidii]|uniref:lycopene cyclase family protein n=1 Tax=Cognatitamlana onchidii TaxID=2562860 RepID=UPI0010A5FD01|nr:lycopene cyclase family protein [Algibacter onchidii]